MRNVFVPGTRVMLLSTPSKMPGYSWGIPAHQSCPRANGDICGACYASKGFYRMPSVVNALNVRFAWTRECMKTYEGQDEFVRVMVDGITRATADQPYFRIHDSGDFFNAAYVMCWFRICEALPNVRFWAPTKAWQLPASSINALRVLDWKDRIMDVLITMAKLPNVTIRPSALNFGDHAPKVAGLNAGSTADGPGRQCPSHEQGNQCGACRACWNAKKQTISYRKH